MARPIGSLAIDGAVGGGLAASAKLQVVCSQVALETGGRRRKKIAGTLCELVAIERPDESGQPGAHGLL